MWIRALQREGLYVSPYTHLRSSLRPLRQLRVLAVPTGPLSALVGHILGDFGATIKTVAIQVGHFLPLRRLQTGQSGRPLELDSAHSREYLLNVARKSDVIVSGCSLKDLARKFVDVSSLRRLERPPLYVQIQGGEEIRQLQRSAFQRRGVTAQETRVSD